MSTLSDSAVAPSDKREHNFDKIQLLSGILSYFPDIGGDFLRYIS